MTGAKERGGTAVFAIGVAAVILLAAVAGGQRLGYPSFQLDESATWYNLSGSWDHFWYQTTHGHDCGGFVYGALVKLWGERAGFTEGTTRAPGVLFFVLMVGVVMLCGARLADRAAGLAAGFLCAIHPALVASARQARAYPLLLLVAGLGFFALISYARRGGRAARLLLAAAAWLAVLTHGFGAALWAGLLFGAAVIDLLDRERRPAGWRHFLLRHAALLSAAIPFAVWHYVKWRYVKEWLGDFWLTGSATDAMAVVARELLVYPLGAGAVVVAGLALVLRNREGCHQRRAVAALAAAIAPVIAAPWAATVLARGDVHFILPRYFLPAALLLVLLAGHFVSRFPRPLALGAALVALAGAAWASSGWYASGGPTGPHARELAALLRDRVEETDEVWVTPWNETLTLDYYGVPAKLVPVMDFARFGELPALLARSPRPDYWIMFFHWQESAEINALLEPYPQFRSGRVCLVSLQPKGR